MDLPPTKRQKNKHQTISLLKRLEVINAHPEQSQKEL